MPAVALDELRITLRRQARHRDAHGVVQAQPDHVARARAPWHFEAELAAGLADALGDGRGRVDDRAVPVEHEQPILHGSAFATNDLISAGSGDSSRMVSPRTGCRKESFAAWSRSRCLSSRLSAKSPYLSSPTIGCPACARCTRIWCVRPVRS